MTDMKQLCEILRSGAYTIHCGGEKAEQEQLTDYPAGAI